MSYTEKIIKIQNKYGLKTSKMAYIIGISQGTYRNLKSKSLFKEYQYNLICKYLENISFNKRK